jgi:hypothetical protein
MVRRLFETLQIGRGSAGKRWVLGAEKVPNLRQFERLKIGHGEAGIRAADVCNDGASPSHFLFHQGILGQACRRFTNFGQERRLYDATKLAGYVYLQEVFASRTP